jgi:protein-S-isoprenylcysteine O-methyltransferase Ste14
MMISGIRAWIEGVWLAVMVFWALTALRLKPVARRQTRSARLAEVVPLALAAFLMFGSRSEFPFLNGAVFSHTQAVQLAGLLVTAAGALIAILARAFLGANWSGNVTIKEGHELIRRGPYAVVRHPIYSGLLLSVIGTAVAFGEVRHILAVGLVTLGFWLKIRHEERLLTEQFGQQYSDYRRRVRGALIPYIL